MGEMTAMGERTAMERENSDWERTAMGREHPRERKVMGREQPWKDISLGERRAMGREQK